MTVCRAPSIEPSMREALSEVYDPCCRDKGISVVDMGLVHRAEIDDGAARVELMLTSGWCPFAARGAGDIESRCARSRAWTPPASSWSGTRPGHPNDSPTAPAAKLRFLPGPATVGDPASYVAANWARPPR